MPEDSENHEKLNIRCPQCRQRFSVDASLMDRMVECGGCDTRFRINQDVIVRAKKFYPGERKAPGLNRFQRVPLSAAAVPDGMQTIQYAEFDHPERLGPASPLRIIAGAAGVVLMVVTGLLLIFSVEPGDAFSEMSLSGRLVIAVFAAVLGLILLVYANPKARLKAGLVSLLMGAGVIALPFFFGENVQVQPTVSHVDSVVVEPLFPEDEEDELEVLRVKFGTKPLEAELERLEQEGSENTAYGIYLTQIEQRNVYTARDYLIRDTEAGPSSHRYPRDNGDVLVLLTDVGKNIETVAQVAARLGTLLETHPELNVIVVRVDNEQFLAGAADKLNNRKDPAFYELNRRELSSIDLGRVESAVGRLATAEPSIYRTDISRRLVELLTMPGVHFQDEIARALLNWAEEPGLAGNAAFEVLKELHANQSPIPEGIVGLVVAEQVKEAIPTLHEIWMENPNLWEPFYEQLGPEIEDEVLKQTGAENATLRRSALKVLAKVGTKKSLPTLQKLKSDQNPDVRVLAERAHDAINSR